MVRLLAGCYESGVRLGQSLYLFPSSIESVRNGDDHLRSFVLTRVVAAMSLLPSTDLNSQMLQFAQKCLDEWQRLLDGKGNGPDTFLRIRQRLMAISDLCVGSFNQHCDRLESEWSFQLGIEIVDGSDETISDGTPRIVPAEVEPGRPESAYSRLAFDQPRGPCWEWNDEPSLRELLRQLDVDRELIFPDYGSLDDEASDRLPQVPIYLWGWVAIEQGLVNLRGLPRPRWDNEQLSLFVGDIVVRKYLRGMGNQITVLNAFENAKWRQRVENPLPNDREEGTARLLSQTILDLNSRISPRLIRFNADGSGRIIYRILAASEG